MDTELTQLAERLGIDAGALIRDVATPQPRLSEADQTDRAARGRALGLSGLALQFFVEAGLPTAPRTVYASDGTVLYRDHTTPRTSEAKPQEAKRPKPKGQSAPQNVKLREADDESALTELFAAMGMSDSAASIAAKGRDR
jgi:hypothetical protein